MSQNSSCIGNIGSCCFSSFQKTKESKKTDVVLLTSFVALLAIGLAASFGGFNFIGTTNATYLSYGMYGGAAVFLAAEAIKIVTNYCSTTFTAPVPKDYVAQLPYDRLDHKGIEFLKKSAKNYRVIYPSKILYDYIIFIIDDTRFQENPKDYLKAWDKARTPESKKYSLSLNELAYALLVDSIDTIDGGIDTMKVSESDNETSESSSGTYSGSESD